MSGSWTGSLQSEWWTSCCYERQEGAACQRAEADGKLTPGRATHRVPPTEREARAEAGEKAADGVVDRALAGEIVVAAVVGCRRRSGRGVSSAALHERELRTGQRTDKHGRVHGESERDGRDGKVPW
jgi:hypothetical protein